MHRTCIKQFWLKIAFPSGKLFPFKQNISGKYVENCADIQIGFSISLSEEREEMYLFMLCTHCLHRVLGPSILSSLTLFNLTLTITGRIIEFDF
jgi:hypothetical protein